MTENTTSENATITVGFLRLCGSDVKCLCCGQIYRSAMEKLIPQGICGRCFQAAFPVPFLELDRMRRVFEGAMVRTPTGKRAKVCFVDHVNLKVPDFVRPGETEFTVFEYGFNMPFPMSDLKVDDKGISAVLSFSRISYATFVPWEAIVGIRIHEEVESISPRKPTLALVP